MYLHENCYYKHSDVDRGHFGEKGLTENHPLQVLMSISIEVQKVKSHV